MIDFNRIITILIGLLVILGLIYVIWWIYVYVGDIFLPLAVLTIIAYFSLSKMSLLDNLQKLGGKNVICNMCKLETLCDLQNKGRTDACSIFEPDITEISRDSPP